MNILMGFDGSWHSDRALRWALHEASARGATVTVLEVFHIGGAGGSPEAATSSEDQRAIARRHVEHALTRAGPIANGVATRIEVSGRAGSTSAAAVLLERARDYDLLVVGARGLGGLAGSLLGSVSQQATRTLTSQWLSSPPRAVQRPPTRSWRTARSSLAWTARLEQPKRCAGRLTPPRRRGAP